MSNDVFNDTDWSAPERIYPRPYHIALWLCRNTPDIHPARALLDGTVLSVAEKYLAGEYGEPHMAPQVREFVAEWKATGPEARAMCLADTIAVLSTPYLRELPLARYEDNAAIKRALVSYKRGGDDWDNSPNAALLELCTDHVWCHHTASAYLLLMRQFSLLDVSCCDFLHRSFGKPHARARWNSRIFKVWCISAGHGPSNLLFFVAYHPVRGLELSFRRAVPAAIRVSVILSLVAKLVGSEPLNDPLFALLRRIPNSRTRDLGSPH